MMRVALGDCTVHEVEARDAALLYANSSIHIGILPSEDIFTRFAEYISRHLTVPQPDGIVDWYRQSMDQILDSTMLQTFRSLGVMFKQVDLVNLSDARAIELAVDLEIGNDVGGALVGEETGQLGDGDGGAAGGTDIIENVGGGDRGNDNNC